MTHKTNKAALHSSVVSSKIIRLAHITRTIIIVLLIVRSRTTLGTCLLISDSTLCLVRITTEASLVEIVDYEKEQQEKAAAVATAASAARGTGAGVSRKRSREEKKARKREKKERKRARKHKKKEKKLKKAIELADREPPKGGVGENDRHPRRQEESGNTESRTNGSTRHEESSRGALARGMEDGDRGRAGSRERDYRNGAVGGNSGRGRDRENWEEGRQSADWNRQKVRQLQRHSAIRHRSKSPPAYEYRQHSTLRIEGGRKVKGSRDRHPREYGSPRNLEGPRETNTCDQLGGDDGKPGVARIKRSPSASSSSTGSSSSSSGSSQSGNSDENRNRNRDTRGKQDKPPNGRGGTHERSRSRDGVRSSHNRYTRSRSRSPEWRMGNHSRKKSYGTNRLENRRRGSDMGKERDDRDWRR